MRDVDERQIVLTARQYAIIAGAEQALREAQEKHQLVLAMVLAGADIADGEPLRVDRKDEQLLLIYRVPRPDA